MSGQQVAFSRRNERTTATNKNNNPQQQQQQQQQQPQQPRQHTSSELSRIRNGESLKMSGGADIMSGPDGLMVWIWFV